MSAWLMNWGSSGLAHDSRFKDEVSDVSKLGTKIHGQASKSLCVAGASFDKCKLLQDGTELHARHSSHLTVWGMNISAAVLYMPPKAPLKTGEDVMNPDVPKALEVHYLKGIGADQLRWVTSDSIAGNGLMDDGVAEFNKLYQDVSCGDSYCLTYAPGKTAEGCVTLSKNGIALGSVLGNKLSKAIYSVWFGEYVWFKQIKEDLLGLNGSHR